ncbi:MAG: TfoX/Sxy family protein [Deltaproteobacteria bacterium]|nr:TfoX/Sxy family protein [Deltaproteobacteria bacterium]
MAVSPSFVEHALDLVSLAAPTEARRMFGGYGLFSRGLMYGLLDDEELFLKTDVECRQAFVDAGCRQWVYESPSRGAVPTGYFRPPDDAHESPEVMLPWARLAVDAAARKAAAKAAKGRKRAAKAGGRAKPVAKASVKKAPRGKAKTRR